MNRLKSWNHVSFFEIATTVTSSPLGVQWWRVSKASGGEGFRVSATVNLGGLAGLANLLFLVLAQFEVESAQVLVESLQIGCAWDLNGC